MKRKKWSVSILTILSDAENLISFFVAELRALELQTGYFSLRHIKAATGDFDPANKIGEGGFGPVYKVCDEHIL